MEASKAARPVKRQCRNKRKRSRVDNDECSTDSFRKGKKLNLNSPLNGLVVAVSTLDVKGEAHSDVETSYKSVVEACRKMGASVAGQVHGRLTCVVCSRSAVQNLTQRVRKAIKKNIPLIDIAWLNQCQVAGSRVDHEPYRLDQLGEQTLKTRNKPGESAEVSAIKNDNNNDNENNEEIPESGWSEPVELGCCCVCHENRDDTCPWCTECCVNRAKTSKG